jgi:hypothetical protein
MIDREAARKLALDYFARHENRVILVGQVSLHIANGYGLNKTERLLEEMVREGIIQRASQAEQKAAGYRDGYVLTSLGVEVIRGRPPA